MGDKFETVEATCKRFESIVRYDAKHLDFVGAFKRIAELNKREMAAKDALIKELADALEASVKGNCSYCARHRGMSLDDRAKCLDSLPSTGVCKINNIFRGLVAKAREVL